MKKTLKRALALMLTVIMIASVAAVMPATAENTGVTTMTEIFEYKDGNKDTVVKGETEYDVTDDTITVDAVTYKLIDTVDEFLAIKDALTTNYIIMEDIDFSSKSFSDSIITGKFAGILDGNGKSLKSITMTCPTAASSAGLFQNLTGTATVKNLTVNMAVTGTVTLTKNTNIGGIVGGIPHSAGTDIKIQNVTVNMNADVTNKSTTTLTVSGMAGAILSKATISDCTVNGSINVTTASQYGYACGVFYYTNVGTGNITVENTVNNAHLTVTSTNTTDTTCAAGIMGCLQDNGKVTLKNTTNNGNLTSAYRTSGLVGFARKQITTSNAGGLYNYFSIINCENNGTLSGTTRNNFVDYVTTHANCGVVGIGSVDELITAAEDNGKYYILTADIDLENTSDANEILAKFADSKLDFCGHKITGSTKTYTVSDPDTTTILQPVVTIDPDCVGYQTTAKIDGKYDVRFLAVVDDYDLYDEIGFDVTINGETVSFNCWNVYNTVLADSGKNSYSADQLGGKYIVALKFTGVTGDLSDVEITPWVIYKGTTDKSFGAKKQISSITASEDAGEDVSGRQS